MTHPALHQELIDRLRQILPRDAVPVSAPEPVPEPTPSSDPAAVQRGRATAKRLAKRMVRRVVEPVLRERVEPLLDRIQRLEVDSEALREAALDQQQLAANLERLKSDLLDQHKLAVDLALLSGEVRALQNTLEEFGQALAPDVGLAGARMRFAELRDRVNTLDRRFRAASELAAGTGDTAGPPTVADSPAGPLTVADSPAGQSPGTGLDYVAFERRFRGDPVEIAERMRERYVGLLAGRGPILDIGCGRGELLELLAAQGADVVGVDTDPGMVDDALARGLEIHHEDAISYLARRPEGSLGAIVAIHVIEHLSVDQLVSLLELAATRLRPGGMFVAETPNPRALAVLGNSYILDPTHVWPMHPSLVTFLCESSGFHEIELRYYSPGEQLDRVDDPEAPAWVAHLNAMIDRINQAIFGPQEYAIIASTKPD